MPKVSTKTPEQKAADVAKRAATFKDLASKRLATATKAISLLGNLAAYKPSDAQRDFIFNKLTEAATTAHARFSSGTATEAPAFEIPD